MLRRILQLISSFRGAKTEVAKPTAAPASPQAEEYFAQIRKMREAAAKARQEKPPEAPPPEPPDYLTTLIALRDAAKAAKKDDEKPASAWDEGLQRELTIDGAPSEQTLSTKPHKENIFDRDHTPSTPAPQPSKNIFDRALPDQNPYAQRRLLAEHQAVLEMFARPSRSPEKGQEFEPVWLSPTSFDVRPDYVIPAIEFNMLLDRLDAPTAHALITHVNEAMVHRQNTIQWPRIPPEYVNGRFIGLNPTQGAQLLRDFTAELRTAQSHCLDLYSQKLQIAHTFLREKGHELAEPTREQRRQEFVRLWTLKRDREQDHGLER